MPAKERYLDPKNDLTFKKVFGQHPHLLKSFLNAVLPLAKEQYIVDLVYLPTELVPEVPVFKNTIVDVRCVDNQGRHFIVEMQVLWTDSFFQRVLFNASKAYVKQIRKGQEYRYLQPVYSLALIDEKFDLEHKERYYHHYQIVNIADTQQQIRGLEFVFVELPKFRPGTLHEKKLHVLWLRFLTEIEEGKQEIAGELLAEDEIREAIHCLRESAFTEEELQAYDRYWDQVQSERSRILDSLAKGEQIGLEKGEQIGLEKGIHLERQRLAERLFSKGFDNHEVAEFSELSLAEISSLREKWKTQ